MQQSCLQMFTYDYNASKDSMHVCNHVSTDAKVSCNNGPLNIIEYNKSMFEWQRINTHS